MVILLAPLLAKTLFVFLLIPGNFELAPKFAELQKKERKREEEVEPVSRILRVTPPDKERSGFWHPGQKRKKEEEEKRQFIN